MPEINDLRQRVEAAEQRFGLLDEQQRHYSERLIGLIDTIEAQLASARSEIEQQIAENRQLGQELAAARGEIEQHVADGLRLSTENEELRRMLHSILQSIEQKTHMKTLQDLEARVSALVAGGPAAATAGRHTPAAEGEAEPDPAITIEIEPGAGAEPGAEAEEGSDAAAVIVEAAEDSPAEGAVVAEAAPDEAAPDEAALEEAAPDEAAEEIAAEEIPSAFETAPEPEIEAEAEIEAAPEAETDPAEAAASGAELIDDDAEAAMAEAEAPPPESAGEEEIEAAAAEQGEAEESGADEGHNIFAAMAGLAGGSASAEVDADGEEVAPTVKEIIRRVGDLARELERAEATRRAARAAEPHADATPEAEAADDPPPFHRAANG